MGLSKTQRISILLAIDIVFFLLEIVVGYAVHSLALVADAFHMFNDILSLLVGLWAVHVATTGKATKTYTYGWQRAETLGALVNGVFLIALCVTIVLEAIQRFIEPPEISNPKLVMIVGCCGLASNILGLFLFHDHGHGHGGHGHSHGHSHDAEAAVGNGHLHTPAARGTLASNGNEADKISSHPTHRHSESSAITISRGAGDNDFHTSDTPVFRNTSPGSGRRSSTSRYAFTDVQGIPTSASEIRRSIIQAGSFGNSADARQDEHEPHHTADTSETPLLQGSGQGSYGSAVGGNKQQHTHSHEEEEHHGHAHGSGSGSDHSGHGHSHGDLNMQGVFLHVMGDALGNVGVIASALFIWLTRFSWRFYADPLISLIITVIILCSAIPLCRAASHILLQGVPPGINIDKIREDIEELDHIVSCHHLHVWQLSDTKMVASLHVQIEFRPEESETVDVQSKRARTLYMDLAKQIHLKLHEHGIDSSTIQPEFCTDSSHRHIVPRTNGEAAIVDGDADEDAPLVADAAETCLLECDASCGNSVSGQCCDPLVATAGSVAAAPIAAAGPSSSVSAGSSPPPTQS